MTVKTRKMPKQITQYAHPDKVRVNNPPAGLATAENDPDLGEQTTWHYDPHIDPQLDWTGKSERTSFDVPTVCLHVHERIDPQTIIQAVRNGGGGANLKKNQQIGLFEERRPLREAVEFYKHRDNWSNRLVAGDSLLVMNSLLQKESMTGKVQVVYIDPPYGIKYGSNFQPFVNKREAKDGKDEDLSGEPETIKAFRDTWELGIHSYLTYLRDRLLLVRDLLHESGSVFVQIGDENVHRVSMILDDIFGAENRVATITFAKTSGSSTANLPQVADYLLWYTRNRKKIKYRQIYEKLTRAELIEYFNWDVGVELSDGTNRKPTGEERADPDRYLPEGSRIYRRVSLDSQGVSTTGRSSPFEWQGQTFRCGRNRQWSISHEGLTRLGNLGRLEALEGQKSLMWKKYEDEVPGKRISNIWPAQMYPQEKRYVVETSERAITRCLLMATDPGDLVLDITCGSGTTAYVAEQWGRRWITCDTSRIAVTLAKHRLMTAHFDYYQLRHPEEGVGSGFEYERVNTYSPKILADGAPPKTIDLYNRPLRDTGKARVTGPFTVEAVPAPYVKSIDELNGDELSETSPGLSIARTGETLRQHEWRDELGKCGVRGKNGQRIRFSRVEPMPCRYLHADAETLPSDESEPMRAVISFGPEHAPLGAQQVEAAINEAESLRPNKPAMVIFAAFQFDPEAAKDIDETNWPGVTLLKAQMNADLHTGDLKKKRSSNESFWLIGQPDARLVRVPESEDTEKWIAEIRGFDYFDIKENKVISGNTNNVVAWMLDTNYDERSLYPRQVFFPMAGQKNDWENLAKNLKAEIDEELIKAYAGTVSLPFELGDQQRVAVKIIDDRGTESLRVLDKPA